MGREKEFPGTDSLVFSWWIQEGWSVLAGLLGATGGGFKVVAIYQEDTCSTVFTASTAVPMLFFEH